MVNSNILFANQPAESGPSNAFNITRAVSAMKDAPYQNQLLQAQVQGQQLSNKINQNQLTKEQAIMQLGDAATDALILQPILQSGDMNRVNMFLDQRVKKIQQRGGDPADTLDLKQRLNSGATTPEQAQAELMGIVNAATQHGIIQPDASANVPAGIQEFNYITSGFTPEEIMQAKYVHAGLKPRSVMAAPRPVDVGGVPYVVNPQTSTGTPVVTGGSPIGAADVAQNASTIKSAEEAAKNDAAVKKQQDLLAKKNATALRVYDEAIANLGKSLGQTDTGPIAGLLPAVTAKQQIAEGAIAAMAPTLKEIFKAAGEGTFTDTDQKLLLDMIPKRNAHPEAIKAQMESIDRIVRAKLGGASILRPASNTGNNSTIQLRNGVQAVRVE